MANDDDVRVKLMVDAARFGGRAAEEEPAERIPGGVGSYLIGFVNALMLAQEAPAVAAEILQVFSEDAALMAGERRVRISTNQREWIAEWRQLLGH